MALNPQNTTVNPLGCPAGIITQSDNPYPFKNQTVRVRLDASTKSFQAEIAGQINKRVPLKGLVGREMEHLDFLAIMCDEARSEWKTYLREQHFKAQKDSVDANDQ